MFHFAVPWAGSGAGPLNSAAAGAVGTWHLLLAARDAGCRRVVLASGGEVYGRAEPARVHEDTPPAPATAAAKDACWPSRRPCRSPGRTGSGWSGSVL